MTIAARCSRSDEVDEWNPFFPRCMSPFMAQMRSPDGTLQCPSSGVNRTYVGHGISVGLDPERAPKLDPVSANRIKGAIVPIGVGNPTPTHNEAAPVV